MRDTEGDFAAQARQVEAELTLAPIELVEDAGGDVPSIDADAGSPPASVSEQAWDGLPDAVQHVAVRKADYSILDPDGNIDLRGKAAPVVLLHLRRVMARNASGAIVNIAADAPDIATDLAAYARVSGDTVSAGPQPQVFRIRRK